MSLPALWHQLTTWRDVLLVVTAAGLGLVLAAPGRWLVDHGAINAELFVLVFAAAVTLPLRTARSLRSRIGVLVAVTFVSTAALPIVAWLAAQIVPEGAARLGVMCIGIAPAEIATVALTATAGGATAVSAFLLLTSTLITVVMAAPILRVLAGAGNVQTGDLVVTMVFIVLLPFALGMIASRQLATPRTTAQAERVAAVAVAVLVGLVATQLTIDATFARALLSILAVLAGGVSLGWALSRLVPVSERDAVLLSVSMRDFAVASGVAAAAFGAPAAAPLGLYGVVVMIWGSAVASHRRRGFSGERAPVGRGR